MGYPHHDAPASLIPRKTPLVPQGVGAELQPGRRPKGGWALAARFVFVMLAMLLAVTMLPAAGPQTAYADEPVERPATSGGDVALESANGDASEAQTPVAETREDGMLAADGLVYTVADGGLALVSFDGEAPEGALTVPTAVVLDGKETPVVAIDLAEGQVAGEVVVLSLPQGIKAINTASLASAFPALLSVEVASASSSLPVASGAASMRAAYSTSGGMLFRPTSVTVQSADGTIESIECKELLWAPPALVSARIPVECSAIAEGAFADVRGLRTIVAFGTMERIADGAFSTEQMESSKVVVPQASAAVTDSERVSASMALMGDAGQKERRSAWHEAGWRTDDIVMGKPYGSLTETVAVTDEGAIERTELQLVSYPGAHERAMDLKKPNADGIVEQAESGLAFTVKSDMTAIVMWQGDKTVTPSHIDIPATVVIDGVTYPVTEIAAGAFEGAAFLQSISIPEGVTAIGQDAFKDCANLTEPKLPSTLRGIARSGSVRASMQVSSPEGNGTSRPAGASGVGDSSSQESTEGSEVSESGVALTNGDSDESIEAYSTATGKLVIRSNVSMANFTFDSTDGFTVAGFEGDMAISYSSNNCSFVVTHLFVRGPRKAQINFYLYAEDGTVVRGSTVYANCGDDLSIIGISGTNMTRPNTDFTAEDMKNAHNFSPEVFITTVPSAVPSLGSIDDLQKSVKDWTGSANHITKAVSDLDNFYDKAKFNTIGYEGLDEADYAGALPTFYVNDASKLPKVPEPRREGHEFLGWTWAGQATPTKDPSAAFSGGGAVTLTANWDEAEPATPEAKHFFTSDAPLRHDDASTTQAHVIKVRLSSAPGTLARVSFEGDDRTGLLRDTSGVRLFVGASEDALSSGTELPWGGATPSGWECELARFADSSYGVYVGVSIPTAAIDEASIPVSYADGSYVASLVKMNYAFA